MDMELSQYFKSIVDQDETQIVICDLDNVIIYMNPAAVRAYEKRGGAGLIGKSLFDCHNPGSCEKIRKVVDWFTSDTSHNKVFTTHNDKENKDVYMVALRDESGKMIGYYEKHEYRNPETDPGYGPIPGNASSDLI